MGADGEFVEPGAAVHSPDVRRVAALARRRQRKALLTTYTDSDATAGENFQ